MVKQLQQNGGILQSSWGKKEVIEKAATKTKQKSSENGSQIMINIIGNKN